MNDELPDIFAHLPAPPAPEALRGRVLAEVNCQLARRKPHWERVLELSVAASFLVGVGLNAWGFSQENIAARDRQQRLVQRAKLASSKASRPFGEFTLGDPDLDAFLNRRLNAGPQSEQQRMPIVRDYEQAYEKLLAELSRPSAG